LSSGGFLSVWMASAVVAMFAATVDVGTTTSVRMPPILGLIAGWNLLRRRFARSTAPS
jgi:hypothetical protein